MLAKLPVIASNSGGHKETIINKKNGWLFQTLPSQMTKTKNTVGYR